MAMKFVVGDGVGFSEEARRVRFRDLGRVGRIVGFGRDGESFYVIWDGYSEFYREAYHGDFLIKLPGLVEVVP